MNQRFLRIELRRDDVGPELLRLLDRIEKECHRQHPRPGDELTLTACVLLRRDCDVDVLVRRCGDGAGSEAVYARATLTDDLHAGVGDRDAGPAVADTNADRRVIFLIESTDRCQN